jgi:glycine cleavage system H lipoate-binding protein
MVAIFIVLTIITFLVVDLIHQRVQKRREATAVAVRSVYRNNNAIQTISVPEGLFFHPGHSWAAIMQNGRVRVGIDDFTSKLFGGVDAVEITSNGREVKQGDPLIVLHKNGRKAELVAPVDGIVETLNDDVAENPQNVKTDPYNSGWICEVKPTNLGENLKNLSIAQCAKQWARDEVARLREFFSGVTFENQLVGQTMQDGGTPVEGVIAYMNDDAWNKFQNEFLNRK